ncbi:hypothetical protein [Mycobacterium sp. RTGN5]|uniref:hypothetical protein n=1 Tax=Mycobacterium sp. RTGN5 TaxID=3016522 RepID=UPI0029C7ECEB|nr:hypothetical protein [Mycobacterium sp. RTGN5]
MLSRLWLAETALEVLRVSDELVLRGRFGFVVDEAARLRAPVDLVDDALTLDDADGRDPSDAELLVEDAPWLPAVSAAATAAPPIIAAPMPRVITPAPSHIRGLGARRLAALSHRSNSSR